MRSKRIMVKLSLPMAVSLDVLSERQGLPVGTIAFQKLREALQRTMDTDIVQERVGKIKAQSTVEDWRHDQEMAAIQLGMEESNDTQATVSQG